MVDERESPSAGWREVYHEMDADTRIEDPTVPCPDCGRACQHIARDVYDCAEHGLFRASAESAGPNRDERESRDSDESESPEAGDETTRRARWSSGPV
ncbi:hypothetical protein [Halorussus lipolyticus]|uniref:hypothetical protein n=1 Tax=Halorussus lipolyticus TaxID=3034024 RepID=UPI0023E81AAA|nr:hypothetical protein [Halorussus sp. DT80]